jgi:hypothetical protein
MTTPVYATSPIRARRTRSAIEELRATLREVVAEDPPMTVRQVFYRMVSRGAIAKSEAEYKQTVCRLLGLMRREGEIPFEWLADNTRWMRKSPSYSSLSEALRHTAEAYRRAIWDRQAAYVEVWLEKDALAGVLVDVTDPWDVPLMVTRGYSSLTYLYSAAEAIKARRKPAFLYYFGDLDPSGLDIPRKVEADLRAFAPAAEIHFERVAVTPEQVREFSLPTRPTKKTDSRSRGFDGESVEVDALPPRVLRSIVEQCITQHVNAGEYQRLRQVEDKEREDLAQIAAAMGRAA